MLLFLDGQSHYGDANIDEKYTAVNSQNCTWSVVAEGRFNNCLKRVTDTTTPNIVGDVNGFVNIAPLMTQLGPWTPNDGGAFGFAIKVSDLNKVMTAIAPNFFFRILEGDGPVFSVILNTNGTFSCYYYTEAAFDNGYVGSSIQGIRSDAWAYIEFRWTIHASTGTFKIILNGVQVFSWTGRTTGTSFSYAYTGVWTNVSLLRQAAQEGLEIRMCDLYLCDLDDNGDAPNTWCDNVGDITVDKILPEGVGSSSDFTPSTGDNWENVDDVPPDEDTTYNSTTNSGDRDMFEMQDLPAGTQPIGFQTLIYARKETEGAAMIQPSFRHSGANYDATAQGVPLTDGYRFLIQPYDTNPGTDLRATEAEINACEAGYVKET